MIIQFDQAYLQELYENGKTSDKKHRYQPEIVRGYRRCVALMYDVPDSKALTKYNGLNYEKLQGNKKGIESVRVNDKYRIEFTTRAGSEEDIMTVCNIVELSNHYK